MIFNPSDETLIVTLLVLPDASLMSLAATLDPMRAANRISGRELYRWRVVSPDGAGPETSAGLGIRVDGAFCPDQPCDLLIVIAAFNVTRHAPAPVLHAVRRAARVAGMVGGVEAGAWVLAMTGLLDGLRATTHWEDLEDFAARFPQIDVRPDRWVIDGKVFTTGGAAPALDFMLAMIRARNGFGAALNVASVYIYDETHLPTEAQPLVSLGRMKRREPRLAAAIRLMEEHLDAPLPVSVIARRAGCSPRTLEGLFRSAVQTSPGAYYLSLRLSAARRLVVDTDLSMAETAVRTGFSSIAALSRAFRRHYGHPPSAARRRLSKP